MHIEFDDENPLTEGNYYVFAELDAKYAATSHYVITAYGAATYDFEGDESEHQKRYKVISGALKSFALQAEENGNENVGISDMSANEAPGIKKYQYIQSEDNCYMFIYIVNGDESKTYYESCEFTTFENLALLAPFSGKSYEVTLKPGDEAMIVIKILGGGYNISY